MNTQTPRDNTGSRPPGFGTETRGNGNRSTGFCSDTRRFATRVPLGDTEATLRSKARIERRGRHTLLVAEADGHTREFLEQMAKHYGFRTKSTGSFSDALAIFKAGGINVVLLDADRMGDSATSMLRQLRECDPGAKVILLSTMPPVDRQDKMLRKVGFAAIFEKPLLDMAHFIETVDRHLPPTATGTCEGAPHTAGT